MDLRCVEKAKIPRQIFGRGVQGAMPCCHRCGESGANPKRSSPPFAQIHPASFKLPYLRSSTEVKSWMAKEPWSGWQCYIQIMCPSRLVKPAFVGKMLCKTGSHGLVYVRNPLPSSLSPPLLCNSHDKIRAATISAIKRRSIHLPRLALSAPVLHQNHVVYITPTKACRTPKSSLPV